MKAAARRPLVTLAAVAALAACREAPGPALPAEAQAPPAPAVALDAAPVAERAPTDAGAADAELGFKIIAQAPRIVIELPDGGVAVSENAVPGRARPGRAPGPAGRRPGGAVANGSPGGSSGGGGGSGSLTTGAVMTTIRSNLGDVEDCYGRVALRDSSVSGRVVVQWTLGKDGRPTAVAIVRDTLKDPSVAECIKARARAWRFPAPTGGVAVVSYPFDLRLQ